MSHNRKDQQAKALSAKHGKKKPKGRPPVYGKQEPALVRLANREWKRRDGDDAETVERKREIREIIRGVRDGPGLGYPDLSALLMILWFRIEDMWKAGDLEPRDYAAAANKALDNLRRAQDSILLQDAKSGPGTLVVGMANPRMLLKVILGLAVDDGMLDDETAERLMNHPKLLNVTPVQEGEVVDVDGPGDALEMA